KSDAGCCAATSLIIKRDSRAYANNGNVHLIARDEADVKRSGTLARRRQSQFDEKLTLAQDCLARSDAEILDRYIPKSLLAGDRTNRFVSDKGRDGVRGRRGVAQVAA